MVLKNQMCSDSIEMREKASRICRDYLHGSWKKLSSRNIVIKRISGGLSNWLYHVSLPDTLQAKGSEPSEVLLRLYGQSHDEGALEGVITESVIFTLLSERRLGPRLHGVFPGGRIEEYIPARPLKTSEMADPKLSQLIAEKMAMIHKMNVPISKEPRWLWDTIYKWLNTVESNLKDRSELDDARLVSTLESFDLRAEVDWLRMLLAKVGSPVVFCHNDMQEGNILLHRDSAGGVCLVPIDFEYCSYNYRGFDLANHLLEWTYDYTYGEHPYYKVDRCSYPSRQRQLAFVRAYLSCSHKGSVQPREELAMLDEICAFTLASHLFWGLWSAVNARLSQIPFGYWEYSIERLESYYQLKNQLLANPESMLAITAAAVADTGLKRKIEDLEG